MMPRSCIYRGQVIHRRTRPRRHNLSYGCYWLFIDVDALAAISGKLRLLSENRFNVFALRNKDYGNGSAQPIGMQARQLLQQEGVDCDGCRLFLLTMPRVLGYVFNPLSIYFCYGEGGDLRGVVYEVHNTFGERHNYVVATGKGSPQRPHCCAKDFYVSPFLNMDLGYDFHLTEPSDRVRLAIRVSDVQGTVLLASLDGQRSDLTDSELVRMFLGLPLVTLKVIAAIHWEALRLWLKGVPLIPRRAAVASADAALIAGEGDA